MAVTFDATHAYRGYRRQALYALYRILTETNDVIFQPEGEEDLAILDTNGHLLEVAQVKAYDSNLVLSDFKPSKKDSFFYRMATLLHKSSDTNITIVSFGNLGPELRGALEHDGNERQLVAEKLGASKFISKDAARTLLDIIQYRTVDDETLKQEIDDRLHNSLMGVDPEAAYNFLQYWLYDCSEHKRKITRNDLVDRVNRVGQFLAARAAHIQEWGTTIRPITSLTIDSAAHHDLAEEFYRGYQQPTTIFLPILTCVATIGLPR